jgi:replicative DNA helicase
VAERAQAARGSAPLAVAVAEAAARIAARGRGEMEGVATGFADLDARLGGCLGDGEVAVVAARPGMGKTALGLGILERVSGRLGVPALLVSLEMGRKEIAERLLSGHARLGGDLLKKPWLMDAAGRGRLADSTAELARWPLHVDDAPTLSMAQIASSARRHRARHGVGLVVIDYLQLIDGSGEGDGRASRQEVVARISRRLKTLAKELRIPVVALSQLNRQSETREDRRPRLADLRESGAIEQDADVVVLLHRPEYYDPNDQPGGAEAIVAKNRNGATGTVRLAFLKGLARFEDHAADHADIPGDL